MDLIEKCRLWHEQEEYQNIIDAIEALPAHEREPQLVSDLARAYNNVADGDDRASLRKAVELLRSVEAHLGEQHSWNFRLGYAYFYLGEEALALRHFRRALEASPGDEDTEELIDECLEQLALPRFDRPFRRRIEEGWSGFLACEGELRSLLAQKDRAAVGEALTTTCREALHHAFHDVAFELGWNGEKPELVLIPDGDRARLFQLVEFRRRAPRAVLDHWSIRIGRAGSRGFAMRAFEQDFSAEDVRVWITTRGEDAPGAKLFLELHGEKLLPLLREDERKAWWIVSTLLDLTLGDIAVMELVDGFDLLASPKDAGGIPLDELPKALDARGLSRDGDPERFLENGFVAYRMKPDEDPDADVRLDVYVGVTRCPVLIEEYLRGASHRVDAFHHDGAVPGFFYYPLDTFNEEENRGKAVLDFREALEAFVREVVSDEAVVFTGGATGEGCGYLDFIAWDLRPVLDAAASFFRESPVDWAAFHAFRRDVSGVVLKRSPEDR